MTGLPAGDFNRYITIRRRGTGVDALNRPNAAFEDYVSVWASHRTKPGMGRIAVEGGSATIGQHSWRVRFREDITIDMQVVYENTTFAIVDISQDYANKEWTDLICATGVLE